MVRYQPLLGFFAAGVGAVLPYFILGKESAAVRYLFLDGATSRVAFATVIMWVVAAVVLSTMDASDTTAQSQFPATVVLSVSGFTVGMASIVFFTGRSGLFDLPYYIQKMYWVALYVSVPVALASGFNVILGSRVLKAEQGRRVRLLGLWLVIALVPLVQGRTPNAAAAHLSVDWFARGVYSVPPDDRNAYVAFSMRDRLGSHLANLALRSASTSVLSPDVAISGNPYLACQYANREDVDLIYTTPNGGAELVASGCNRKIDYAEEGRLIGNPAPVYAAMKVGVTERLSAGQSGLRFLLPGFLQPRSWGVWASGYRSAIGLRYRKNLDQPSLTLTVRPYTKDKIERTVIVEANDVEVGRRTIGPGASRSFTIELPGGPRRTQVEVTLTCERSDKEIIADSPADGPEPCFGLEAIRLDNN